ncbi:hypothetical protein [Chryseobacterium rhizoplanae]|nr:hypothetical protein [Chryseobacterium rhizoplanae]
MKFLIYYVVAILLAVQCSSLSDDYLLNVDSDTKEIRKILHPE